MQPKICETHILEDTLPGGTLSESIEHIPVSFLSRIDFKYVYPHVLYFSRNNAIRIFHVFVFAILRPCVGLYRRIDSPPMLHKSLSAFECARAYNNDESLRNQLQINSESATGSHFLWSIRSLSVMAETPSAEIRLPECQKKKSRAVLS